MYGQALTPTEDTECARVGRGAWQGAPKSGRGKRDLGRGTYGAYSGGGVLGTTLSNMSSRVRTSSRRRALTWQKRGRVTRRGGEGGELGFGRRHDGWGCASIDSASWGEGKGKREREEQHLLARRSGDLHQWCGQKPRSPAMRRRWQFTGPCEAPTPRPGDLSAMEWFTCRALGGEGSCSGFATQACESLASEIRAERGRAELMNRQARQFAAASTGEASADALVSKGFGPPALLASGGDVGKFII